MKIAFATTFDAQNIHNWSGTPYHMSCAFAENQHSVHYIGHLKRNLPLHFKFNQFFKKLSGQRESPRFNEFAARKYSEQVEKFLQNKNIDVVISPLINPIAFLTYKKPIVLWTDALYAGLLGFYPAFSRHSANSIRQGNAISAACLKNCTLAIFSSEWAARTAIEIYGADEKKIKVVPFGANLRFHSLTQLDIKKILKEKTRNCIKLLFIGKHWYRKGGDIVFRVAKKLYEKGQKVEVHFVGCMPPPHVEIPPYIICHGFISKQTQQGQEKIKRLFYECHFLFVPSRAEAYGIVFAEANAFGLPVLTSHIGGITSVVKKNINGMTFSLHATENIYSDYIIQLTQNNSEYEKLALSAFRYYQTQLNWQTATKKVEQLIQSEC